MSDEEEVDVLQRAVALRCPVFRRETPPRAKVEALEEYTLLIAYMQGEMNEEKHDLMAKGNALSNEWATLDGWQMLRQGKTDESINEAKRQLRPDLWLALEGTRQRLRALLDEIERLERDFTKVSRAYSMLTGI